jgi:hypothetical protein
MLLLVDATKNRDGGKGYMTESGDEECGGRYGCEYKCRFNLIGTLRIDFIGSRG